MFGQRAWAGTLQVLHCLSMCLASTSGSAPKSHSLAGRTMLAVQPRAGLCADEELGSICARACIRHAEQPRSIMAKPEVPHPRRFSP